VIRFVIVTRARCGFNMIMSALNSHPSIRCFPELYNPDNSARKIMTSAAGIPMIEYTDDPIAYLESLYDAPVVGFKLEYTHCREGIWESIWDYILSEKLFVIHLQRRNFFDRLLSYALVVGNDNHFGFTPYSSPVPINIDNIIPAYFNDIKNRARINEIFSDNPLLEVYYEDIQVDGWFVKEEMWRMLDFLSVRRMPLKTVNKRQRVKSHAWMIENYYEVWSHLASSEPSLLRFLEDIPM